MPLPPKIGQVSKREEDSQCGGETDLATAASGRGLLGGLGGVLRLNELRVVDEAVPVGFSRAISFHCHPIPMMGIAHYIVYRVARVVVEKLLLTLQKGTPVIK